MKLPVKVCRASLIIVAWCGLLAARCLFAIFQWAFSTEVLKRGIVELLFDPRAEQIAVQNGMAAPLATLRGLLQNPSPSPDPPDSDF